jgi:hypothetical protein
MISQHDIDAFSDDNIRTETLRKAADLINGDRQQDYGTPQENFTRIAAIWSIILGHMVRPDEVALCMAGLKLARLAKGPHEDSYIDGCGYMAIAAELSRCK